MNAAVSFTMCVFGRLGWGMLPLYVFAQLLGSFLAAGTVYAVYYGEFTQNVKDVRESRFSVKCKSVFHPESRKFW